MLCGFPKRPALRNTRLCGLSVVSYGLIRYERSIPVSPLTCCCSVRSVCRYIVYLANKVIKVIIINTALPSVQRRFTSCSIPHGLHRQTPVSSSVIGTVWVASGNRTGVDAKICETSSPIVTTEAIVLRGGGR